MKTFIKSLTLVLLIGLLISILGCKQKPSVLNSIDPQIIGSWAWDEKPQNMIIDFFNNGIFFYQGPKKLNTSMQYYLGGTFYTKNGKIVLDDGEQTVQYEILDNKLIITPVSGNDFSITFTKS